MGKQKINYRNTNYEIEYAGDFIEGEVQRTGTFFELVLLEQLKERVKSFDVTVDIGANIGNHTHYFINVCNAKEVYAFEPIPENAKLCLRNNPQANIYEIALSNYEGSCNMVNNQGWNSGTSFVTPGQGDTEVRTLDSFNLKNITFVKIDVEGEELRVLEGMQQVLLEQKPELLVEVHNGITIENILQKLPEGYKYEYLGDYHYFLTVL